MPPLIIARPLVKIMRYWGAIVTFFGVLFIYLEYEKIIDFKDINGLLDSWLVYIIGGLIFVYGMMKLYKQKKFWSK